MKMRMKWEVKKSQRFRKGPGKNEDQVEVKVMGTSAKYEMTLGERILTRMPKRVVAMTAEMMPKRRPSHKYGARMKAGSAPTKVMMRLSTWRACMTILMVFQMVKMPMMMSRKEKKRANCLMAEVISRRRAVLPLSEMELVTFSRATMEENSSCWRKLRMEGCSSGEEVMMKTVLGSGFSMPYSSKNPAMSGWCSLKFSRAAVLGTKMASSTFCKSFKLVVRDWI